MKFFKSMKEATELVASISKENEELKALAEANSEKLAKFDQLSTEKDELNAALEVAAVANSEKAVKVEELGKQIVALEEDKKALSSEVETLKASAQTAEAMAREIVASTGGKPLAVDSSDETVSMSREDIIKASYETKDAGELKRLSALLKATK